MYTPTPLKLQSYGFAVETYTEESSYICIVNDSAWFVSSSSFNSDWTIKYTHYTLFSGVLLSEDFFDQLMIAVGFPNIPPSEATTDMDIGSGNGYPSSALSNFAPHPFILDGVQCNSCEGFLQSVKYKELDMQEYVCSLVGKKAKFKGKKKNWYVSQTLYWRGVEMKRDSQAYQDLLDRAYEAMADQSNSFRKALLASGTGKLTHSMGKRKINETVLTTSEFCGRLMRIRDDLQSKAKAAKIQSLF